MADTLEMLHQFLARNREELIGRCREKVAKRPAPSATPTELHGIPVFLDQLTATLRAEAAPPPDIRDVGTHARSTAIERATAGQHGNELLQEGYTVDQVVHDYGDLCQAVTELALEKDAAITTDEFRTLNRCLDNAIADAVTEFERQRDQLISSENTAAMNIRLGSLAHELRNLTANAMLAVAVIKKGNVGVAGATGAMLDRTLIRLRDLIDRALVEVRLTAGIPERRERMALSQFIDEVRIVAALQAQAQGFELAVAPTEKALTIEADRQILAGALGNLLHNAFKFTRPRGRISLKGYAVADRILIEVEDECGGLAAGATEMLFLPFEQFSAERTGLGLGLSISRRGVEANGGKLRVRNLPGVGCVFTIDLPKSVN